MLRVGSERGCETGFARARPQECGPMFFEPQNMVEFCGSELLTCSRRPLVSISADELRFFDV